MDELKEHQHTAQTLLRALPYMRQFSGATFVIKYGGHAMGDPELAACVARDVTLLRQVGIHPVIVHGGGPQIGEMLKKLDIESSFVDGLRVTDHATVTVAEMVLSGAINKEIVANIHREGGRAVGISGKDGQLIAARKLTRSRKDPDSQLEQHLDLGFVGEPVSIDPSLLKHIIHSDAIPIIAPIGMGENGETYNINADTAAGAIAEALNAEKLIMLTDVAGLLNKAVEKVSRLSIAEARGYQEDGTISGGMIPKMETCIHALEHGVHSVHMLDGRIPHVLLIEIFTQHGAGTMLTR